MKRIFSFLFAIITLVGTTGVFTSCQEDAAEIDKTIKTEYVTFTAVAEQTLSYEGSDLQYSTDGITFNHLPANTPIEFGGNTKLYLRGVNNLDGNYYKLWDEFTIGYKISFGNDVPVACTGDIRTLIDYKTYKTVDTRNATFRSLFYNCTQLTSAPALPATTLADNCYFAMFMGCTSLKEAPELPATTLAEDCYCKMFDDCISLEEAPELPATTLAQDCYNQMFYGCSSLVTAPELPATTLAEECYYKMFYGCTSLKKITMLATDISATDCLYNWVKGVPATGTFTKAASMTTLPTGDSGIPAGWTVVNQ